MVTLPNYVTNKLAFLSPRDVPSSNFSFDEGVMNRWQTKLQYTKDAALLCQQEYQYFFVYDRLMAGQHDFPLIEEYVLPSYATAFTSRKFCNWRKNLGSLSFPIALETDRQDSPAPWTDIQGSGRWFGDAPPASVKGQLYHIKSEAFYNLLDKHYRNGYNFIRKKVKVISVHRQKERPFTEYKLTVWAWIYVGNPEHWDKQFNGKTGMMFFNPVKVENSPHKLIPAYSFFEYPTGEAIKDEEPAPVIFTKLGYRQIPLVDSDGRVVGSGFEHINVPEEITDNPYQAATLLDGASPVQRTIEPS